MALNMTPKKTGLTLRRYLSCLAIFVSSQLFAADHCDQTQLYSYMTGIKTELKSLTFEVKTERFTEAQSRVDKIITLLNRSAKETPFLFLEHSLQGEQLQKKQMAYKGAINKTIDLFTELNLAIKTQDIDKIKPIMAKIGQARKSGHRQFKARC
ncbi:hypothetical protein CBF23_007930 [Marinomonas agarivorans]|nr:hypothetical protein CBF23_007930 [Marinomonas agarivorans]